MPHYKISVQYAGRRDLGFSRVVDAQSVPDALDWAYPSSWINGDFDHAEISISRVPSPESEAKTETEK
jgi:hypothetical protein